MRFQQRPLPEVSISQVESYLSKKRWLLDGRIRAVATVWHRDDSADAEVLLPLEKTLRDYAQRMRDAVGAIAEFEKRSIAEVIGDIVHLFASTITVRVIAEDTKDGTIPINDGVLLVGKAKDMLTAAALAMFSKRKQFGGKPPKEAAQYIESLLLGQTDIGSYVVNVIAPAQTASHTEFVDGVEPTEGIALSLTAGLDALTSAGDRYLDTRDPSVFEGAIAKGVSANLCDALLGFSGAQQQRAFEVRITGASGPMFDSETRIFEFGAEDLPTLRVASDYYKDDYVLPQRKIVGFVKKLHRPKGEECGTVTVEATVNDLERSIQIELGPDDYHKGVIAHDKKIWVECLGDVHVKSRTTRLLNPGGFRLIRNDDLFDN